jgi:hypothetical protein
MRSFQAVEDAGLRPSEFRWETTADGSRDVLVHEEAEAQFAFGPNLPAGDNILIASMRAYIQLVEGGWRIQRRRARAWLAELKHELETPDLWAQIEQESQRSTRGGSFWESFDRGSSNAPFTSAEREEIAAR